MSFLQRHRWIVLAVLAVGLGAGAAYSQLAGRGPGATVETSGGGRVAVRGSLGPTPGPDANGYVAAKRAYLERQAAKQDAKPAAALVSLSKLLTGADVIRLLQPMRADLLFVRLPGSDPEVLRVAGDADLTVKARALQVAAQLEETARQLDPATAAQKRAQAAAMSASCPCVYGVLVSGTTLGDLVHLQGNPLVRVADVADPPTADLRGWELRPILPPGA